MRGLTLTTLLLGLPGCSISNPAFSFEDPTSTGGTDTASATSETTPTTSGASGDANTSDPVATSEPVSSTTEPGSTGEPEPGSTGAPDTTDTGDPVDSSSSTGADECPSLAVPIEPYLFVDGVELDTCPTPWFYGKLKLGLVPTLVADVNCNYQGAQVTYTFGNGYTIPEVLGDGCFKAEIVWNQVDGDCKISTFKIYPFNDPNNPIVFGAFSVQPGALGAQQLTAANHTLCGCPDGQDCCEELDPGELTLQPPGGDPVPQSESTTAMFNNLLVNFYNLQSWVDTGCMDDPNAGHRIDWVAITQ